jgi:hypothetical protein
MHEVAPTAAVAALFLAAGVGGLANLFSSHYRVYGLLAGACGREWIGGSPWAAARAPDGSGPGRRRARARRAPTATLLLLLLPPPRRPPGRPAPADTRRRRAPRPRPRQSAASRTRCMRPMRRRQTPP